MTYCKTDFDLTKLGLLKGFRKQLNVNRNGLCWRNKIVVSKIFHVEILKCCHDHPYFLVILEKIELGLISQNTILGQERTTM